jgi:O-antigen ligase
MAQVPQTYDQATSSLGSRLVVALPILAGLLAVLATQKAIWVLVALVVAAVVFVLANWPEASTLTVIFILYTNMAKVAVDFHGVPFLLGASFFLLLVIPLFFQVVMRREKIIVQPVLVLLILFVLVQLIGVFFARHPDIAAKVVFTSLTEGILLFFLISNVVRNQATLRRVVWTLVAAGMFMSVPPLYQQVTGQYGTQLGGFGQVSNAAFELDPNAKGGPVQPRLAGSLGEQNRFAQVMLVLLPLALFRWWGESKSHLRMLAALATGLIASAVILTFSRGAAVGIVAILLAMVALRYISVQRLSYIAVVFAIVLAAVPQYGTRMAKMQGLWSLVSPDTAGQATPDGSAKSRITEMGAAGLAFLDHPVVGVGPGMFRFHYREYAEQIGLKVFAKGRYSHSIIPGIAAENGALGLFLFAAIILVTMRDLLRAYRRWKVEDPDRANMAASFALVIIAYMTTAMFLHLGYVRYFWLVVALATAASRVGDEDVISPSSLEQERI